jgi:hypothetical protein
MSKNHSITLIQAVPGFLRSLGAFEEILWLYSQTGPRGFAYALELEGPTTVEGWRKALDQVQASQPLFSACIEPNFGGRPYFRHVEGAPIPMRVLDGMSAQSWETEMAKEIFIPFSGDHAPLLRTVLIHQPQRSTFISAAHPSIADGISMTAALHDLVRALSGETIELHPLLPSQEEALQITRPNTPEEMAAQPAPPPPTGSPMVLREDNSLPPTIQSLRLDGKLVEQLRERVREEGTTVHGALCAAMVCAGRRTFAKWNTKPVRVLSSIDSRPVTNIGDGCSLQINTRITLIAQEGQSDFWELARHFIADLAGPRSREGMRMSSQTLTNLVAQGLDSTGVPLMVKHAFALEASISNVGVSRFPSRYGDMRVKSLWGSAFMTGSVDEQFLGVGTFNNHLHLLHTSYLPIPDFLRNMESILTAVSDSQSTLAVEPLSVFAEAAS